MFFNFISGGGERLPFGKLRVDFSPLLASGGVSSSFQFYFIFLAEARGFEPLVRLWRTALFESALFDHSSTPPFPSLNIFSNTFHSLLGFYQFTKSRYFIFLFLPLFIYSNNSKALSIVSIFVCPSTI